MTHKDVLCHLILEYYNRILLYYLHLRCLLSPNRTIMGVY